MGRNLGRSTEVIASAGACVDDGVDGNAPHRGFGNVASLKVPVERVVGRNFGWSYGGC